MKTWVDWENIHQLYELRYHIEEGIAWCADEERFKTFWAEIFRFIGARGRCLDVGCGPRPPFGRGSTAIDPLVPQYQRLVPEWWEDVDPYALPAERFITELAGSFDTVLCWNCLDHTIGWQQILLNLAMYGQERTTYAIATDFNPPHVGHPGFEREEFFREVKRHFRIVRQAEDFQERDVALVLCGL